MSEAYDATLSPIHTYFVRMAIKTSIYLLPDRATFIASIGETGAGSAPPRAAISCRCSSTWLSLDHHGCPRRRQGCPRQPTDVLHSPPAEESARLHAATFVPAVEDLMVKVLALYEGTSMPASDVRFLPSSA